MLFTTLSCKGSGAKRKYNKIEIVGIIDTKKPICYQLRLIAQVSGLAPTWLVFGDVVQQPDEYFEDGRAVTRGEGVSANHQKAEGGCVEMKGHQRSDKSSKMKDPAADP